MAQAYHHALEPGTRIENFEVRGVLGVGGFGITYKGYDHSLHCDVAIKEYLPNELALRTKDGSTVVPKSDNDKKSYQYGLKRFLDEARTLAKFREPNIVRVTRFLECNGTAYLVMDYEDGQSLSQFLRSRDKLTEDQIRAIFIPLLNSLRSVHAKDYLHRDIKPANIYLRKAGSPVLLDFGAARAALGGQTRTITGMVTPGYAPFEQYHTRVRQGPWTDLYAMGATIYRCITGNTPVDATERVAALHEGDQDPLVAASLICHGKYSQGLLEMVDWMLKPNAKDRPQDVRDVLVKLLDTLKGEGEGKDTNDVIEALEKTMAIDSSTGQPSVMIDDHSTSDQIKAAELTKRIAKEGDSLAQLKMSAMYARGRGVTKNTEEAASWCQKAAQQGNALAQYKLAMLYAHGYGMNQNKKEAYRWCKLAADQGNAPAQFNLGLMFGHGIGIEKNSTAASLWYKKAAEQGHQDARNNLSVASVQGGKNSGIKIFAITFLLLGGLAAGYYIFKYN